MTQRIPLDDGEVLWRRVHRTHLREDGSVSTAAFRDIELSVDRAEIQRDKSITLAAGAGIAQFDAGLARVFNQEPVAEPNSGNAAHALVLGSKPRSVQRGLR